MKSYVCFRLFFCPFHLPIDARGTAASVIYGTIHVNACIIKIVLDRLGERPPNVKGLDPNSIPPSKFCINAFLILAKY